MKKIAILLCVILICLNSFAQFPLNPTSGVNNINQNWAGAYTFQRGMVAGTYADTTAANLIAYMKGVPFIMISTTTDNAIWFRNSAATKWIQLLPSGSPTGLGAWTTTLNTTIPTDISLNGYFGTTAANGIGFYTSNTQRLILPAAGLTFNQVVSDTTLNKVMTYNTSTKSWGYSYWFGGGAATTPTWQETLDAGSNLDKDNLVDAAGFDFQMENASAIHFQSSGVNAYTELVAIGASVSNISYLQVYSDSVQIKPYLGHFEIDTLLNKTQQNTLLGWVETSGANRGEVGYVTLSGLTLSGGVLTNPNPTPGANTALSNLASVAINTSLLPGTTNSIALGSTSKIWSDVQTDYFHTGGLNGTYGGYSGGQLGGVSTHAVLDFYDANTRIGEFYTTSSSFNFFTGVGKALNFYTNNSTSIPLLTGSGTSAQLGVNMTTPAAQLHISAGSTAAGSAPLKFTAGTNMTAAEAGAMEWDGTNLFITQTTGPTRKTIAYTSDLTGLPYIALTGTSNATGNIELSMNSGPYDFSISEANTITLDASVGTKTLYFKSQAISSASVGDALTVVNTTTGEIGTAPNLAFNFQKEKTMIYAKNGRLFAEDATGNLTAISPHWFTEEFKPSEEMAWSFYSRNEKIGKEIFIDMLLLARKVEEWTGEKLVYIKDIPKK